MRIAVVGAGAVGGYYGGTLAKHGEQVTLICRGAHRDAIVRDGLHVSSYWGDFTVHVPATADPHEVGPVDLIIYAVKTYHNPAALPLLEPLLGADTAVLSIQNGVESPARIAAVYGWGPVLAGTTYIDAARPAPGRIEQVGATARIVFGEQDGSHSPRAARVADVLTKEGLQVEVSSDIVSALWAKLVLVAATGTVMTAARATYPEVLACPVGALTVRAVMEEIVAVGQAHGAEFVSDVVDVRMATAEADAPGLVSSLQLDFQAGNPLELDDLLGAVVRQGRAKRVPVPASAALYTALYKFRQGHDPDRERQGGRSIMHGAPSRHGTK